jgi:hypothetical protein
MVVEIIKADHIGDKVMPSSSDVYNNFLDRKNGVRWEVSKPKWKLLHTTTSTEYKLWEAEMERGFTLCNLTPMDTLVSTLITIRIDGRVNMM